MSGNERINDNETGSRMTPADWEAQNVVYTHNRANEYGSSVVEGAEMKVRDCTGGRYRVGNKLPNLPGLKSAKVCIYIHRRKL